MADIIAQLGLDVSDFNAAAKSAAAQERYLADEAKKLDAVIRILERDMRNGGKATGAQVAQLGQLRQALKQVQADYKATIAEKKAFDRIDTQPGVSNVSGRRAGDSVEDRKASSSARSAMFRFYGAVTAAVYAVTRFTSALFSLGEDIQKSREKFSAGSQRREDRSADPESRALAGGLDRLFSDSAAKFKTNLLSAGIGAVAVIGGMFSKLFGGSEAFDDYMEGLKALKEEQKKIDDLNDSILDSQDELSVVLKNQNHTFDQRLLVLQKQLAVAEKQLEVANQLDDRQGANQARAAIGAVKMQMHDMNRERDIAEATAHSETEQMLLQIKGMKKIADLRKTTLDYDIKIAEARKMGLDTRRDFIDPKTGGVMNMPSVVDELEAQKLIAQKKLAVEEHNLSSRDILSQRREARKFARDDIKTGAQADDMKKRLKNAGLNPDDLNEGDLEAAKRAGKITRGSRLDRFASGEIAKRNALPDTKSMTVNEIKATTITATNINLKNTP